jgi:hypothetical protein
MFRRLLNLRADLRSDTYENGLPSIMDDPPETLDEQIGQLRNPCDLDVLLFFSRHSRSLLTSGKLAEYVGYDAKQVGSSLDRLIAAGVLTRSQNATYEARLYVLVPNPFPPWLKSLLTRASSAVKVRSQTAESDTHKKG